MTKKPPPQPILATTRLSADLDQIVASAADPSSLWKVCRLTRPDVSALSSHAGVYCFVLPESALPREHRVVLRGRTFGIIGARRQLRATFEYQPKTFARGRDLVIYVGKAANIRSRIKGHFSVNPRATTNQVLRGLAANPDGSVTQHALRAARNVLQEQGSVYYYAHFHPDEANADYRSALNIGQCLVAERDLLEIKLIASYAPPFNIKAER